MRANSISGPSTESVLFADSTVDMGDVVGGGGGCCCCCNTSAWVEVEVSALGIHCTGDSSRAILAEALSTYSRVEMSTCSLGAVGFAAVLLAPSERLAPPFWPFRVRGYLAWKLFHQPSWLLARMYSAEGKRKRKRDGPSSAGFDQLARLLTDPAMPAWLRVCDIAFDSSLVTRLAGYLGSAKLPRRSRRPRLGFSARHCRW